MQMNHKFNSVYSMLSIIHSKLKEKQNYELDGPERCHVLNRMLLDDKELTALC